MCHHLPFLAKDQNFLLDETSFEKVFICLPFWPRSSPFSLEGSRTSKNMFTGWYPLERVGMVEMDVEGLGPGKKADFQGQASSSSTLPSSSPPAPCPEKVTVGEGSRGWSSARAGPQGHSLLSRTGWFGAVIDTMERGGGGDSTPRDSSSFQTCLPFPTEAEPSVGLGPGLLGPQRL